MQLRDDAFILKCMQYAKWTLAHLMVDTEIASQSPNRTPVERDYQSYGAMLVNNLGPKLTQLLFPSNRPFYSISLSDTLQAAASAKANPAAVQSQLSRMEMDSCQGLFRNSSYSQLVAATKHLIVTGNALTYRDSKAHRTVTYGLQQYVVQRDARGVVLDVVLREFTYFDALDVSTQTQLIKANPGRYGNRLMNSTEGDRLRVELYTRIERQNPMNAFSEAKYVITQQADTVSVGTPSSYPEHLCPYQVLTWTLVPGEHYGRGLVEDFAGDFASLSDLSLALGLYNINMMRVVNLVQNGAGSDIDEIAQSETGQFVQGNSGAISAYEAGDANKAQQVNQQLQETFSRLTRAFMYSANTRDAERVTAYELQQAAQEVENTLGGVYSSLAESWQVPLAHILLLEVNPGVLEGIVTKDVKLDIMAGIPALGRASDVQNILQAVQEANAIVIPLVQVDKRIDPQKLMDIIYAGRSVDTSVLFKSPEQIAKEQQADQQIANGQQQVQQASIQAQQQAALQALGKQ
jgi:hypothetical protein